MGRRAVVGAALLLIVPGFSAVAAAGAAPGRVARRGIGSAVVTPAAGTARQPALRAGRVPAAAVGAPPGSQLVAPSFPLAPATVSASAMAGPVLPFGTAASYGSLQGVHLNQPIVGMAASPTGRGYWVVAADGGIFGFGDARFFGSTGNLHLNQPIVGMAASPTGRGYWLVARDGGIFGFGDARFFGSTGNVKLNQPVVGMAASPTGRGYWLVARDGGIFGFGDARFFGSTGNVKLNQPVVGMAASPAGRGYWLVARDGGIFGFGDAHFFGSTGDRRLNQPIVAMAATRAGHGYWIVAAGGGVFTFGDGRFYGSAGNLHLGEPVVGMAATADGHGYWLVEQFRPNLFSLALVASLNARADVISASVLDLVTGITYDYRPGQLGITCSIVKVEILGTLLTQAQASGRSLTPTEQALATAMIERSDNGAATTLWAEVGRAPAVHAFDEAVGLTATTPNVQWGLTTTTAADQVTLLQHIVHPNAVLSDASRAYVLGLMEHVTSSQAWGVSAGVAPGATVALKNGWLPFGAGWNVNSIGWIHGDGRDYLIAVTTFGNLTENYGIDSISEVAIAAWNALGH